MIIRDVLEKEITRWTQVINENAGGMCEAQVLNENAGGMREECEHCIAWHDCVKDVSVPMAELWWRIDALEQFDRLEEAYLCELSSVINLPAKNRGPRDMLETWHKERK